ncbi:MAG: UDP-3-O-acyl-N-acetylglucosamine deacetylase [Simkaniaceae bacterium]
MASVTSTSKQAIKTSLSSSKSKQKTLSQYVSIKGTGLFTGCKSEITLCPAPAGTGIVFKRVDLPNHPLIPAKVSSIFKTPRCTILGNESVYVQSVEHILSAINAYDIDNLYIEVSNCEIPSGDGSANVFVELIEKSGIACLADSRTIHHLTAPIFWSRGEVHLIALPSEEFRISYTLSYPNSKLLESQFYSTPVNPDLFKKEIASCRTFSLYEEIVPLIEQGLIKGGTLDNGVVIKNDAVINPEGLRFSDECVRHKVLDLIGDISLIGFPLLVHIVAIKSGHTSNTLFAKEIVDHMNTFRVRDE